MQFSHNFQSDLHTVLSAIEARERFVFARYGDGERKVAMAEKIDVNKPKEHWKFAPGENLDLHQAMVRSLNENDEAWHIGISCPCCDRESASWYRAAAKCPPERMTFANLFVNGNWTLASQVLLGYVYRDEVTLACSSVQRHTALFPIPQSMPLDAAANCKWWATLLLESEKPIFCAAGPMTNIIAHQYLLQGGEMPFIDIGSCLDPFIHGMGTRGYHYPGSETGMRACHW